MIFVTIFKCIELHPWSSWFAFCCRDGRRLVWSPWTCGSCSKNRVSARCACHWCTPWWLPYLIPSEACRDWIQDNNLAWDLLSFPLCCVCIQRGDQFRGRVSIHLRERPSKRVGFSCLTVDHDRRYPENHLGVNSIEKSKFQLTFQLSFASTKRCPTPTVVAKLDWNSNW